jgi:ubiquinone/menaquinone biosynthesis C-methylase UbiE
MPDQREIYNQHAEQYERLVSREDHQGNILSALVEIYPFEGGDVVELGAGTGRLTRLLVPLANTIWLLDISGHMLGMAARILEAEGARNWRMAVADHRNLPLADGIADAVISGWSVCYLAVWSGEEWREEVGKALREMERVLRDEGIIILLETLGTGYEEPEAPEKLRRYYEHLKGEGFSRKWIRTDLEFESLEEAVELMGFFFGEEMAAKVEEKKWVRVPECTGIWWRDVR